MSPQRSSRDMRRSLVKFAVSLLVMIAAGGGYWALGGDDSYVLLIAGLAGAGALAAIEIAQGAGWI